MRPLRCVPSLSCCGVLLALLLCVGSTAASDQPAPPSSPPAVSTIILNAGQWDDSILACVRGQQATLWLTASAVITDQVAVRRDETVAAGSDARDPFPALTDRHNHRLTRIGFPDGLLAVSQLAPGETVGYANFLIGNDPRRWVAGVPMTTRLSARNLYPNVDLELSTDGTTTMSLVLHPPADPSAIRLDLPGRPRATIEALDWQDGSVSLSPYLQSAAAALDYGTFLGGAAYDVIFALAVGGDGAIYAAGNTESATFPTLNAYDPTYNAGSFGDLFLTKFSADGLGLIYSTYIGGTGPDILAGMVVDPTGRPYLTGVTGSSTTFPIVGAYDPTYGGTGDAFIMRLNPAGSAIEFSTFIGGANEDYARGIAIDAAGNAYICGHTKSSDFPALGGLDASYNGGSYDAFITKLDATGAALAYSAYIGGSGDDQAFGIAVDAAGRAHVRGWTTSPNFPAVNAMDNSFNGGDRDVFLARLNPAGSAFEYSTYLGGDDSDYGVGLALDDSGFVYLGGVTRSQDFPLQNAYDNTIDGLQDLFVMRVDSSGQSLRFSTLLGGSAEDFNGLAAVDLCGQVYVSGYTYSTDFPTAQAFDDSHNGGSDLVVAGLSADGSALVAATFLGGADFEFNNAILLRGGRVYVAGVTSSSDFPVAAPYDGSFNGNNDGVLAILSGMGVNECGGCLCLCAADPACDGIRSDVLDVVKTISVAFRGGAAVIDPSPTCPRENTDVNCSGTTDIVDVVKIISVAFRGGSPATEYCDPCL